MIQFEVFERYVTKDQHNIMCEISDELTCFCGMVINPTRANLCVVV